MAGFIGKTISLISQSDIRYRGILHSIDASQATIQLSNVYSMGTENRRPVAEFIPPQPTPYEFILFRAKEVKDLSVDSEPLPSTPAANVHNDPAIIGVSQNAPTNPQYDAYPNTYPNGSTTQAGPVPAQAAVPGAAQEETSSAPSQQGGRRRDANGRQNVPNAIRSATASLQNVERAMGDLRVSEAARHGRQGNEIQAGNIQVPATDFDFASANAKFDKVALTKPVAESDSDSDTDSDVTNPEDSEAKEKKEKEKKEKEEQKKESAYNPKKSFFDSLTPNSVMSGPRGGAGGRGGGRGRGRGRSRREEEAQRNLMTFGEAIPPAHPNGFSGRRGGRRGGAGLYHSQTGTTTGRPR